MISVTLATVVLVMTSYTLVSVVVSCCSLTAGLPVVLKFFIFLKFKKNVPKLSWSLLKIWSWNFTSCSWEPCNSGFCMCVCVCVCYSFVLYAKLPEARHERSLQSQSQYGCKVSLREEYRECWLAKVSVYFSSHSLSMDVKSVYVRNIASVGLPRYRCL